MKKQLSVSLLCFCLLVIMFVGSSLAWFSDDAYYVDVMTTGNVKITQTVTNTGDVLLLPSKNPYTKQVTVTNEGNTPCFVRTLVAFEDSADGSVVKAITAKVGMDSITIDDSIRFIVTVTNGTETTSTIYAVGIYTHEKALEKSGNNELSRVETMSTIQIDPNAGNAWCDAVGEAYDMLVLSQATQATGWAKVNDNGTEREITAAEALNNAFNDVKSDTAAFWFTEVFKNIYDVKYGEGNYQMEIRAYP